MKFAVLLFLLIPFVAKADSICVEDNTTKCRELGYTESSCPNGGVACQYDTSLWYCANWSCADGRLYSAENKPADKCGNCVATAYKNMTCYDCHEARCTSTTCAVGDVFYSDGTCCPVENFDCRKTPVGVVYALSATKGGLPYTTAQAETPGFKAEHGRVISLRNLTSNSSTYAFDPENPYNNSYSYLSFGLYSTDVSGVTNYDTKDKMLNAFKNADTQLYSGKENTAKFAAATAKYSECKSGTYAVGTAEYNQYCAPTTTKATLDFYPPEVSKTDAIAGAGNWYLPAYGELALLYGINIDNVTSGTATSGATGTTKAKINNTLTILANKGVNAKVLTNNYYWASNETNVSYAWKLLMTNGTRTYDRRNLECLVRASLQF